MCQKVCEPIVVVLSATRRSSCHHQVLVHTAFEPGKTICLPEPCFIYVVKDNQTCLELTLDALHELSIAELQSWNTRAPKLCDDIQQLNGTVVCISPPGGFPKSRITALPRLWSKYFRVPAERNGFCMRYINARPTDTCESIATRYIISIDDLYKLNPTINDASCNKLRAGQEVCIRSVGFGMPAPISESTYESQPWMVHDAIRLPGQLSEAPPDGTVSHTPIKATPMMYTAGPKKGKKIAEAWPEG